MQSPRSTILPAALLPCLVCCGYAAEVGTFEDHGDIGKPSKVGSAEYQAGDSSYRVSGGGENMWFTNDAFHFVWKKVTGDFVLDANIAWEQSGGNAHKKACLIVRQSLTPDSAYVDVAVH